MFLAATVLLAICYIFPPVECSSAPAMYLIVITTLCALMVSLYHVCGDGMIIVEKTESIATVVRTVEQLVPVNPIAIQQAM